MKSFLKVIKFHYKFSQLFHVFIYVTSLSEKFHVKKIAGILHFLIPMEATCIRRKSHTDMMVRIGRQEDVTTGKPRQAEEQACRPVSLEGRNHLHKHVMFLITQN